MNMIKKALCLFLITLLAIGACGCMNDVLKEFGHSNAEYIESIEKYLKEKYSLSFKVDSLGGTYGTGDNTTVKAWCYCIEGENAGIRFIAEIDKIDLSVVKDKYLDVVAAKMISKNIDNMCDSVEAHTFIECSNYSNMSMIDNLDDFFNEVGECFVTTHLFIKSETNTDKLAYSNIVYSLGEKIKSLNLKDHYIVTWFVRNFDNDIYETFRKTEIDNLYDEYLKKDYIICHSAIQISGDNLVTELSDIASAIEKDVK